MQIQVSQSFEENIKKYVLIDNKIKSAKAAIKELEKEKKNASMYILKYIKINNLEEAPINLSDGKIKYSVTNRLVTVNKDYIQNRLELYKNIHQASKNMGRCLDELLYEYKTDQLEIEKPIELIIIPQKGSKEEELHD